MLLHAYRDWEGNGNPLLYSCLENPADRGAWWAAVHGVAQSRTQLKRLSMHACIGEGNGNPLQYSWRTPGTEVSGGLLSMGLHRVGHDWSDLAAAAELFPFLLLQHWFHHVFPYFARPLSLASCPYFFFFSHARHSSWWVSEWSQQRTDLTRPLSSLNLAVVSYCPREKFQIHLLFVVPAKLFPRWFARWLSGK